MDLTDIFGKLGRGKKLVTGDDVEQLRAMSNAELETIIKKTQLDLAPSREAAELAGFAGTAKLTKTDEIRRKMMSADMSPHSGGVQPIGRSTVDADYWARLKGEMKTYPGLDGPISTGVMPSDMPGAAAPSGFYSPIAYGPAEISKYWAGKPAEIDISGFWVLDDLIKPKFMFAASTDDFDLDPEDFGMTLQQFGKAFNLVIERDPMREDQVICPLTGQRVPLSRLAHLM